MKTRDLYFFIYRSGEQGGDIVGYGLEIPQPTEEMPKTWEVLEVQNQVGPDVEWGDVWVAAKKDITRSANHFMKMNVGETIDDFFEYTPSEQFYPTPVNVNAIVNKMKENAEDDWQKTMADHFSEVIEEDEWQTDTQPIDPTKLLTFDTIMERLEERYGDE